MPQAHGYELDLITAAKLTERKELVGSLKDRGLRRRSRARHRPGRLRLGPAAGRRCTGGTTAVRKITAGLFITA